MRIFKIMTNEEEPKEIGFYIVEVLNNINKSVDFVGKKYFILNISNNGEKELSKINSIGTFVEFLDYFNYISTEILDDEYKRVYDEFLAFLKEDFSNLSDYNFPISEGITAHDTFINRLHSYYFDRKIIDDKIDIKDYTLINSNITK